MDRPDDQQDHQFDQQENDAHGGSPKSRSGKCQKEDRFLPAAMFLTDQEEKQKNNRHNRKLQKCFSVPAPGQQVVGKIRIQISAAPLHEKAVKGHQGRSLPYVIQKLPGENPDDQIMEGDQENGENCFDKDEGMHPAGRAQESFPLLPGR